jgi:hypothetical protein
MKSVLSACREAMVSKCRDVGGGMVVCEANPSLPVLAFPSNIVTGPKFLVKFCHLVTARVMCVEKYFIITAI